VHGTDPFLFRIVQRIAQLGKLFLPPLKRERDLVCSMRSFSSNTATRPLMYSEPLSE